MNFLKGGIEELFTERHLSLAEAVEMLHIASVSNS
jgi:hypothetical protein